VASWHIDRALAPRRKPCDSAWLTPEHPDPSGERVRALVRFLRSESIADTQDVGLGLFWEYRASSSNPAPACTHTPTQGGPLGGSFASPPQHHAGGQRKEAEEETFKAGLAAMADLYASPIGTSVLQIKAIPPRPANLTSEYNERAYDARGWVRESRQSPTSGSDSNPSAPVLPPPHACGVPRCRCTVLLRAGAGRRALRTLEELGTRTPHRNAPLLAAVNAIEHAKVRRQHLQCCGCPRAKTPCRCSVTTFGILRGAGL
jgi:hypothetical protein